MAKFGEIISKPVPVVILFTADWNSRGSAFKTRFREILRGFRDDVSAVIIDTDMNEHLATALNIHDLPTVLIYRDGKKVFRTSGDIDAEQLTEEIKTTLKKSADSRS